MTWKKICHHGMSETEARDALTRHAKKVQEAWLKKLRKVLRADGMPAPAIEQAIERVAAEAWRVQLAEIEKRLPTILRGMAITAGAASMQ